MNYQIIATLGPSSDTESLWQAMLAAGVTGFRLNTSHLTLAQLEGWLARLNAFFCTVEEQRDPALRGRPFAVGGQPDQRGVVASCSYAARFAVRKSHLQMLVS